MRLAPVSVPAVPCRRQLSSIKTEIRNWSLGLPVGIQSSPTLQKREHTPQEAIDLPNIIARGETVAVETDREGGTQVAEELKAAGYNVRERGGENSGLHVI